MSMPVRARAARVLSGVTDGRSLADILPPVLDAMAEARQRALLQELVYGTLRWYHRLDALLGQLLRKSLKKKDNDLRCLLLIGLYQLDQLAMPQRVAVNETVQAVRDLDKSWAGGLVNALLRNFQRRSPALLANLVDNPQAYYAHPDWLIRRLQEHWPHDWAGILAANNARPPFCLRVNRRQMTRAEYLELLDEQSLAAVALAHTPQGIMLEHPVPVATLPGFTAGSVSVQDGGAQLAAGLLRLAPGQRVLDACAAPGGKTAHILEFEPRLRGLTAIDIDEQRLQRVAGNLSRAGLRAELVLGDAAEPSSWWDGDRYDRILLDAPCSATGVIRRHPDIKLLRKANDIAGLAQQQARLLQALWPLLAPGGMLLYCTCSVLAEENTRQIEHFLAAMQDAREVTVAAAWGRVCRHGRQQLPGDDNMDGFYFACLRKLD
jgi:16S rRNA (cytosine967-C5)-methyltransferase